MVATNNDFQVPDALLGLTGTPLPTETQPCRVPRFHHCPTTAPSQDLGLDPPVPPTRRSPWPGPCLALFISHCGPVLPCTLAPHSSGARGSRHSPTREHRPSWSWTRAAGRGTFHPAGALAMCTAAGDHHLQPVTVATAPRPTGKLFRAEVLADCYQALSSRWSPLTPPHARTWGVDQIVKHSFQFWTWVFYCGWVEWGEEDSTC